MSEADSAKPRHLYGPVPSRRLGRSLGVDIVPYKVCSYDCIYCQLGRTTRLTAVPQKLVGAAEVMRELEHWLAQGGTADYVTFAGSGEPTLNVELGEMIRATKKLTGIPVAVITNGSLLLDPLIRDQVALADLLVPSLDAGTDAVFQKVNRPAPEIGFLDMREGMVQAAQQCAGEVWLEVMLVEGVNDSDAQVHAMNEITRRVCPDRLQINTVERPSKSGLAGRVSDEVLSRAREMFGSHAEIIAGNTFAQADEQRWLEVEDELVRTLARRPCTLGQLATASGRHSHELAKHLHRLVKKGLIEQVGDTDPYYRSTTGG